MSEQQLLVRDVMRIGVPTCKLEDTAAEAAAQMMEQNATALGVMDEEGNAAGWLDEWRLAEACMTEAGPASIAEDIMAAPIPEFSADAALSEAVGYMLAEGVGHLFFLHHAGGRAWPASVLSLRDAVAALAGPEYVRGQGSGAPRPTPMDLFRQKYKR